MTDVAKTNDSFMTTLIGIPKYIQNIYQTNSVPEKNNEPNLLQRMTLSLSDPMVMFITIVFSIIGYIYLANEFLCQLVGLYYPCRCLFHLLNKPTRKKSPSEPKKSDKTKSIMKYFIIYGHGEFAGYFLKQFFPFFYHIKLILLISLVYLSQYRLETLDLVYQKTILYDEIFVLFLFDLCSVIKREYDRIRNEISKNGEEKLKKK